MGEPPSPNRSLPGDPLLWGLVRLADDASEATVREVLADAAEILGATAVSLGGAPATWDSAPMPNELRVHVPRSTKHLRVCFAAPPNAEEILRTRAFAASLSLVLRLGEHERGAERSAYHVTLGRAVAGVVHDIANPLNALLMSLESIRDGFEVDEAMEDAFASSALLRSAIERLRRFGSSVDERPTAIDVGAAVASALRVAAFETRGRAEVVVRVIPGLAVRARFGELEHVLVNLLINAARALAGLSGLHHRITISAFPRDTDVVIDVEDTGPGVAPEHHLRLFEEGFTTKASQRGSGIGLSLCRDIVTALGGSIDVSSPASSGTRVSVRLPGAPPSAAEEGVAPPSADAPPLPTVLVVDADPLVTRVLKRALDRVAVVTVVPTVPEAEALASTVPFDLVLCEHSPPRVDAIALRERHARRWPTQGSRFIVMLVDPNVRLPPGTRLLTKPIDVNTLRAILTGTTAPA